MEDKITPLNGNSEMNINADADIPGSNHLSNEDKNDGDSLEKILTELDDQKLKYLTLRADFENYKRRTSKEKVELMQTAGKNVILSILEVLDDMDRAEKQMETTEDIVQLKEGNKLVFNKLRSILLQKGLTPMNSVGTEFEVEKHEAITEVPADKSMKGKVVEELEKGYYLNDKIIRFAKVVVGK